MLGCGAENLIFLLCELERKQQIGLRCVNECLPESWTMRST